MNFKMIDLSNLTEIPKFVQATTKLVTKVQLQSETYIANAKSLLGVYSLDLSKPVKLIYDENDELIDLFLSDIKHLLVE